MNNRIRLMIMLFLWFQSTVLFSQPDTKFGAIKPEDFNVQSSLIDSSTNAIVLFDIGNYDFENNNRGWLNLVFTRHTRIKILNKNGYDVATVRNVLNNNGATPDEMDNVEASTFNLVNNEIVQTKLDKKNISEVDLIKKISGKLFTLPAIKEGSIIEYTYTVHKHMFDVLEDWNFEDNHPCLYNEFSITIPTFLHYKIDLRDNLNLSFSKTEESRFYIFNNLVQSVRGRRWTCMAYTSKWTAKNVPSIKYEPYISSINNYISKVGFLLSEIDVFELHRKVISNWHKISTDLKSNSHFGDQINTSNNWLNEPLKQILTNQKTQLDSAITIYKYVRDNFSLTKYSGIYITNNKSLKDIFKDKKGSSSDINMLLIAMLKHVGYKAEPAILRTRESGLHHLNYPILSDYNYLIVSVIIGNFDYLLDASENYMGFARLPLKCYNGEVRVLGDSTYKIKLSTNSLADKYDIEIKVTNDNNGKLNAVCKESLGDFSSLLFREQNMNLKTEELLNNISKMFLTETNITNLKIDSLKSYDFPVYLSYNAVFNVKEDVVYFNPLFIQKIKENPFKSDVRKYPVEMPFTSGLNYNNTIEIPTGYYIDEMPKSLKVKMNDDEGTFNYHITREDNTIHLKCELSLNETSFTHDNYQYLREFYAVVYKKMNEEIVFKKIK